MYTNTPTENIIELGVLIALIIAAFIYKKIKISYRAKNNIQNPINRALIMAYYVRGYDLKLVMNDSINDMDYSIFITSEREVLDYKDRPKTNNDSGATIYTLTLPFNTNAHIVGLSRKYLIDSMIVGDYMAVNDLELVNLEGDFPDDFSLYVKRGQGSITQYILDPAAMAFIVDYCKNNFWEILDDKMYIVCDANQTGGMLFVEDGVEFVRQIKPALVWSE